MKKTCLFLLAPLFLAGCASDVHKTEPAPPAPFAHAVADKRIVMDPALAGAARVIAVSTSAGAQGFIRVELRVQNQTSSLKSFNYRFEWQDQSGETVDESAPTIPMTLLAREITTLVVMAPTPLAKNFRAYFSAVN
jgi:uncharacterized protein YcfL